MTVQFYLSPDRYGGVATIYDKGHKKELVYDCLGVSEYNVARFKTSDISPCVCVTEEEFFKQLARIDEEYARGIHRRILAVPIKEVEPDSKWGFMRARRFDDGRIVVITKHKTYDGPYEYAVSVFCTKAIDGHQHWSWHRLDAEPTFKKNGVDLSEDEVHEELRDYVGLKARSVHDRIRKFIKEAREE